MIWLRRLQRYTKSMQSFNFTEHKQRIEDEVNKRIKIAQLEDPKGFTLIEGIVMSVIRTELRDVNPVDGKILPQVAILGNSSGIVYYFYLDSLFPGEGLD